MPCSGDIESWTSRAGPQYRPWPAGSTESGIPGWPYGYAAGRTACCTARKCWTSRWCSLPYLPVGRHISSLEVQSKPSIAHSSVVEKPSLVDKSWATNCFYVVKALNSGKPSVVDNFFSEVAWKIQRWVGFKLVLSGFLSFFSCHLVRAITTEHT